MRICARCHHNESEHEAGLGCWGKPEEIRTDGPTPGCRCTGFVAETTPGLFERFLNRIFRRIDISDGKGNVYLRRWYLWPRVPEDKKDKRRLYLHKFYRGDNDRHLHDHPWAYRSIILKGGYWEHSFNPEWLKRGGFKAAVNTGQLGDTFSYEGANFVYLPRTLRKWYGVGAYIRRGDKWAHMVELKDGKPCWTLFLTETKSRSWGFHTENGWCWWRFYKDGICWCYDPPNETIP